MSDRKMTIEEEIAKAKSRLEIKKNAWIRKIHRMYAPNVLEATAKELDGWFEKNGYRIEITPELDGLRLICKLYLCDDLLDMTVLHVEVRVNE